MNLFSPFIALGPGDPVKFFPTYTIICNCFPIGVFWNLEGLGNWWPSGVVQCHQSTTGDLVELFGIFMVFVTSAAVELFSTCRVMVIGSLVVVWYFVCLGNWESIGVVWQLCVVLAPGDSIVFCSCRVELWGACMVFTSDPVEVFHTYQFFGNWLPGWVIFHLYVFGNWMLRNICIVVGTSRLVECSSTYKVLVNGILVSFCSGVIQCSWGLCIWEFIVSSLSLDIYVIWLVPTWSR